MVNGLMTTMDSPDSSSAILLLLVTMSNLRLVAPLRDDDGRLRFVFLLPDLDGFAVVLRQRSTSNFDGRLIPLDWERFAGRFLLL